MGITYKIDVEAGVIFTVAEGKIGTADIQANTSRFIADSLYSPNLPQLFDARLAQLSFSSGEAQSAANSGKQRRPTAITAMVINRESQGFARMFLGWRGDAHKIFHDMASAREWLGLPPEGE